MLQKSNKNRRKLNTEEVQKIKEKFILNATKKHNGKYDYSNVEYINASTKIKIICPTHGEFLQTPNGHNNGSGCPVCAQIARPITKTLTMEKFLEKARKLHGNRYDYSKVVYISAREKVIIICSEHGEFLQSPNKHADSGRGCPFCAGHIKKTTEEFIKNAIGVHGNEYDYSESIYDGNKELIKIICKEHGPFYQIPISHINHGAGCPQCCGTFLLTTEDFIKKAKEIHGDQYDYSKTTYINCKEKVIIICKTHGEFLQSPSHHTGTRKTGCKKCNILGGYSFIFFKNNPDKRDIPAKLYFIKINSENQTFFKIGITKRELKIRFSMIEKSGAKIELLHFIKSDLYGLFCLEQKLKKMIYPFSIGEGEIDINGGESECFRADDGFANIIISLLNLYQDHSKI